MGQRQSAARQARIVAWVIGLILSLALPGCGIVFDAPKVSLLVRDDRIVYAGAGDQAKLVGGETVLRIANDGARPRQIVLIRLERGAQEIPREIIEAESAREDTRILGMTHVLKAKEATFETGGFGYRIDSSSFHVHLSRDSTYVIFDRLGGLSDGVVLMIEPGPRSA